MAKGISYPIQGKYNPKGEKDAIKGIHALSSAAGKFNKIVGGFIIAKVFQGITKVVSGATNEFMKDSEALTKYAQSIKNNANLTEKAFDNLNKTMSKFDGGGIFGGDEMQSAVGLANSFKLTEKEIDSVMDAATNMASSGIMPLEQAVKNLSLTYSGNLGQLRKIAPELQNLTDEELANGKAVEILNGKYKGFRDSLSSSFKGMDLKFEDRFGGLQSAIGGIFQGVKFGAESKLLEPLEKMTSWLEKNKTKILKFIYNLPEIFKIVIQGIWELVKKTFSGSGFINLIQFLGGSLAVMVKSLFPLALEGVKTLFGTLKDLFNFSIGNAWRTVQDFFARIGNKLIEGINSLISKIIQAPAVKQIYEFLTGNKASNFQAIKFRFDDTHSKKNVSWEDTVKSIDSRFDKLLETYKTSVKEGIRGQKENLADFLDFYAETTGETKDKILDVLQNELPADLQKAMEIGNADTSSGGSNNTSADSSTENLSGKLNIVKEFVSVLGEIGEVISLIMEKNIIGLIISLVVKLVSAMQEASKVVDAFMNSISLVMKEAAKIVTPIFEKIVKPFVNGIKSLGEIIGNVLAPVLLLVQQILTPILNLLTQSLVFLTPLAKIFNVILTMFIKLNPVLTIFAGAMKILGDIFTFIYNNIFAPITNGLLMLISMVGNFFIGMYNTVIGVLKSINIFGWRPFSGLSYADSINYNEIKLTPISFDSFENGDGNSSEYIGDGGSGSSSGGGGSASYTAARDINVNVDIGYIVGDLGISQFALMIRDEIAAAERLGR